MAENPTYTPEQALAIIQALQKGSGSPAISTPATQSHILIQIDPKQPLPEGAMTRGPNGEPAPSGMAWFPNLAYQPPKAATPAQPVHYGSDEVGYYTIDANGQAKLLVPPHTPNADEEIKKALEREQQEQLRLQRQRNEAAGFGYADDDTVAKRSLEARKANLDEKQYALSKTAEDNKVRQFDIERAAKDKVDAANILLTGAQTGRTGAETAQINQNVNIQAQKLPGDLAQQAATLAGTEASTAGTAASTARTLQQIQQGNVPTVQTPGTGMWNWVRDPNTGELKTAGMNVEYQAKTMPEVQARIGQIQSLMQAKSAEVQKKSADGTLTPDQALAEYNAWYQQQVQPQLGALEAAQQAAQFKQAQDTAAMRTAAQTAATQAAQGSTAAFNALREANPVGPGFAQQLAQAASKSPYMKNIDWSSTVWQGPNPTDLYQQGMQNALKYVDPTSAQAAGTQLPNFSSVDINSMLGANRYMPGAGAPAPAAPMGAAAPAAPVAGPVAETPPDDWLVQLQGRLGLDQQQQDIARRLALANASAPGQVPGQNYGADTAYSGGVMPWNY